MWALYLLIVILAIIYLFLRKKNINKRLAKYNCEREKENAPKILYLRAFGIDGDDYSNSSVGILRLIPKEMELALQLIKLNHHQIAVTNPHKYLPDIGFHRKSFSDETWQDEVIKLLNESKFIIYRSGTTPGLLWEVEKIFELGYREKLVIWTDMGCANMKEIQRAKYNTFRNIMLENFNETIPIYNPHKMFIISKSKNNWEAFLSIMNTPISIDILNLKSLKGPFN